MFRNMSIRTLLIMFTSVILLVPTLTLGISSYVTAKNKVQILMESDAKRSNQLLSNVIEQIISPKIEDVNYFVKGLNSSDFSANNSKQFQEKIETFLSMHKGISATYIGTSDGRTYQTPGEVPKGYDPRTRPWYQDAMKDKSRVIITEPYAEITSKDIIVSICKATDDGSGVFGIDVNLKQLTKVVNNMNENANSQTMILTADHHIIMHPSIKAGEEAGTFATAMAEKSEGNYVTNLKNDAKDIFYTTDLITGWKIGTMVSVSQYGKEAYSIFKTMVIILVVTLLLGTLANLCIVSLITKPLRVLLKATGSISRGDLRERVYINSRNETGRLAEAFNEMADSMNGLIREVSQTTMQLASSSEELTASAEQTSRATEHVAKTMQELAIGAEQQSNSSNEGSLIITNMHQNIIQISESAKKVSDSALQANSVTDDGNEAVQKANRQMAIINQKVSETAKFVDILGERSQRISKIVEVITSIASQTNLLALNAAIEAARAGESGRGFAVVADEVRKLAVLSAESAEQINGLIQEIQSETQKSLVAMQDSIEAVKKGSDIVNSAEVSFTKVQQSIDQVTSQIQEITSAVQTMTLSTEEVVNKIVAISEYAEKGAGGAETVSALTQQQLASMEEITASSNNLSRMAEELQDLIGKFEV